MTVGWDRRDAGAVSAVVAVCVAAFHRHLSWWFTAPDTPSLIWSSRVDSWGDVWSFFTEPLMAGTSFPTVGLFYRPVAHLSFALDHALWGLDPFGYHLTNLLLHTTASVLVYALAVRLPGGSRARGVLAAGFFAVHPVAAEVVPAIERRQDILALSFLLGSLLAYLRARQEPDREAGWWGASLLLALLAFGSKEPALALPGIVVAHAWFVDPAGPGPTWSRERVRWAAERGSPFVAIAGAFFAVRLTVLGGLGGYPHRAPLVSWHTAWGLSQYLTVLVSPLRYVQAVWHLEAQGLGLLLGAVALAVAAGAAALYRGRVGDLRDDLRRYAGTPSGRVVGFCLAWMGGGAILFGLSRTFGDWSGYPFVAPFAIGLSALLLDGVASLRARLVPGPDPPAVRNTAAVVAVVLVVGSTVPVTLAFSPSVRGYEEWRTNAQVNRAVLPQFAEAVEESEGNVSRVYADELPWDDDTRTNEAARLHTVFYYQDYTLEDWARLRCDSDCDVNVAIANRTAVEETPDRVEVELEPQGDGAAKLEVDLLTREGEPASAPGG